MNSQLLKAGGQMDRKTAYAILSPLSSTHCPSRGNFTVSYYLILTNPVNVIFTVEKNDLDLEARQQVGE